MDDTLKCNGERAKSLNVGPTSSGDEVEDQSDTTEGASTEHDRAGPDHTHGAVASPSEEVYPRLHDRTERVSAEHESHETASTHTRSYSHYTEVSRQDSARWTDRQVDEDDDRESGLEVEGHAEFRWSPAPQSSA